MEEVKTPKQMAEEYCDKTPISCFDRLFVSLEEIRIGAFKSGYQAAQQWISVKERLPEDHNYYLVTSKKEASSTPYGWIAAGLFWDMEIAYFHGRNQTWMTGIVALNCKEEDKIPFAVSYWMPLPKPPKRDK